MSFWRLVLLLLWAFVFSPGSPAWAQETTQFEDCAQAFSSSEFADILTRNEELEFGQLDSRKKGRPLLGLPCTRDQLDQFFVAAGWERTKEYVFTNPQESGFEIPFVVDTAITYCKKHRRLFTLFIKRCTQIAVINMYQRRITFISASGTK